jgi:FKBP-type peptidyl-prolyl cis-trans isomerase FkpA
MKTLYRRRNSWQKIFNLLKAMPMIEDWITRPPSSGIHYVIKDSGNLGEHPSSNASVEVLYKGYFLDGRVFDQTSGNKTATFGLNQVIQGWQEAIPLLTRDGKGTFIMPSVLCYGSRGSGSIPPNSVLVFDIELIDFQ